MNPINHQHTKTADHAANVANYLTVDEVANRLAVHPSSVRRWITNGYLKAHRIGPRAIRIASSELERIIEPASELA